MSVKVTIEWEDGATETYETRELWRKEQRDEEALAWRGGRVAKTLVTTQVELRFIAHSLGENQTGVWPIGE